MKKLTVISVFLLSFLILSSISKAAPGPYLSLDLGEYSRRIEENCSKCVDPVTGLSIFKINGTGDSTRLLARLGMDLRFLDVYLSLGGASLNVDEFDGFHGKMSPAFGGGFKILMYESPSYERFTLYINPDVLYFKTNDIILFQSCQGVTPCNINSSVPITENHDISWTEYAIKVGASARYDLLEPYGGISLSFLNGSESGPVFGSADFKERDNLGFFLGANYYFDPVGRSSVYGEIGGGDSAYLKVGIKSRF